MRSGGRAHGGLWPVSRPFSLHKAESRRVCARCKGGWSSSTSQRASAAEGVAGALPIELTLVFCQLGPWVLHFRLGSDRFVRAMEDIAPQFPTART